MSAFCFSCNRHLKTSKCLQTFDLAHSGINSTFRGLFLKERKKGNFVHKYFKVTFDTHNFVHKDQIFPVPYIYLYPVDCYITVPRLSVIWVVIITEIQITIQRSSGWANIRRQYPSRNNFFQYPIHTRPKVENLLDAANGIVSVLHQDEGGIGKSIPDGRKISRDPRDFPRAFLVWMASLRNWVKFLDAMAA